ncbi:class I SAM-dependent methyltransferase [Bacterioplanoides sp.]|uniref:class I SAM-dependent methyltransferase n=1 Tax=Bacterioplanoides sp. TaxID=2066072 RepID=UPI003AFFFE6C
MEDLISERSQTADKTRNIYEKQHNMYLKDDVLFNRFLKMYSDLSYYHLEDDDLNGKSILDAGCGNTAYFQLAMHRFGVKSQTCLELGDNWIKPLQEKLSQFDVPLQSMRFVPGSTDSLPFENEEFDFVSSNGVLVHLNDTDQAGKSFEELARVTKSGGHLYVVLGTTGGLFEEEVFPAVRRFYNKNETFKNLVDNISPELIQKLLGQHEKVTNEHADEKVNYEKFAQLFDYDFCAFLQNVIQAPTRYCTDLDENWVRKMFADHGFEEPKRCRRFVQRKNIRKHFAALHYDMTSTMSQILYGNGNMEWIAKKK